MKKNLLKTMSFALAAAMVVTSVAPAAGTKADAAKAPKLNASKGKTIYLGKGGHGSTTKKFDFNVQNASAKTYSRKFSIGTKSIATVDKNGVVTAKKVGKTTVKVVLTNKKTKKVYKTLKAPITVKDNAKSVAIKNADKYKTLAVGAEANFDSTQVGVNGAKGTDKIYWTIDEKTNTAKATVTNAQKGLIKAEQAGEFTVVVKAAQNDTLYKAGTDVVVSAAHKVTVPVSMTAAKQTAAKKVELTFDASVKDKLKTDNLAVEETTTHAVQPMKEITFSEDGKTATVEFWSALADKKEYSFTYDSVTTKLIASVGAVKSIEIKTKTVPFNTDAVIDYALLDEKGVDVTELFKDKVVFSVESAVGGYEPEAGKIRLLAKGDKATVTVTYNSGIIDEKGVETVVTAKGDIVAVDPEVLTLGAVNKYTLTALDAVADFTKEEDKKIAVGEANAIHIDATYSDKKTKFADRNNDETVEGKEVSYSSSNDDVLAVSADGDNIYAVKEGTAYIVVKIGTTTQWSLPITVVAEKKLNSIRLSNTSLKLSNTKNTTDVAVVDIIAKDQYTEEFTLNDADVTVECTSSTSKTTPKESVNFVTNTAKAITVDPQGEDVGTYKFTVKSGTVQAYLTVKIGTPTGNTVAYDLINPTTGATDVAINNDSKTSSFAIEPGTYKGTYLDTRISALDGSVGSVAGYSIKKDGKEIAKFEVKGGTLVADQKVSNASFEVTSGSAIRVIKQTDGTGVDGLSKVKMTKIAAGNYVVSVNIVTAAASGNVAAKTTTKSTSFKINDTQVAPKVVAKAPTAETDTVLALVQNGFTVDGKDLSDAACGFTIDPANIEYSSTDKGVKSASDIVEAGKTVTIKKLTLTQEFKDGNKVDIKVTLNKTIRVK